MRAAENKLNLSRRKVLQKSYVSKDRRTPVVSSASDLVGKIIDHLCFLGDENIEKIT